MNENVTVEEGVARFKAIGLDQAAMEKWHRLYRKSITNKLQSDLIKINSDNFA